ncbi:type II secretion system secretin GspD [Photobacterium leiognathi]|uniref:type II secretion system secretin GspD n=1 Tax=Photobacterium leiognathi TaxID=553611 RepID=UPI00298275D4|nr:type II secretion system secretin GspD [Photobacterium leiognathi]
MISKQANKLVITSAVIMLAGCTMPPIQNPQLDSNFKSSVHSSQNTELKMSEQSTNVSANQHSSTQFTAPRQLPELGANRGDTESTQALKLSSKPVSLNAQDLPLNKFINLTLGKILNVNYIVDQSLSNDTKPVTLHIPEPVKPSRMLGLVEEVLRLNDVALVQENGLLKVIPLSKASSNAPEIINKNMKRLLKYGQVIEFVPVNYMSLAEASQLAMNYVPFGKGKIMLQNHLNSLILIADQQDIDRFRDMLKLLDKPAAASKYSSLVTPAFMAAPELVKTFDETLPKQGIPLATQGKGAGVTLTPIGDTNRLLLTASSKEWLNYAKYWISQIDHPQVTVENDSSIFTYFLKNAQASDVTDVIQSVFGTGSNNSSPKEQNTKKTESAVRPANLSLSNPEDKPVSAPVDTSTSISTDDYKIVVDKTRNALIFIGSYKNYTKVLDLLKVLDRRPRQVLIEASVMEVSLDNGVDYGVNWSTTGTDGSASTSGEGGIALPTGGLLLSGTFGDFKAQISAAAKDGKVNILSSPRLLAKDGEDARISVGTQIAVKTGSISTGGDTDKVIDSFSYIDTGVMLEITPTINENGLVEMKVKQEVSDTSDAGSTTTPPILKRSIDTNLVAETGQTVVLGGLISQNQTSTIHKVPLLGDIPVLGQLFKSTSLKDRKTELIVTLTPHIIYDRADADFYTKEFQNVIGWKLAPPPIDVPL